MPVLITTHSLQPARPYTGPKRLTVSSTSTLQERRAHLRFVSSELGRDDNRSDLHLAIIRHAQDVFTPFGKAVTYAVFMQGRLFATFQPDQRIPKNIGQNVSNREPSQYAQEDIVKMAAERQVIVHQKDNGHEFLALPILKDDKICGKILLSNQLPSQPSPKPFSSDDIQIAKEFVEIASDAIANLSRRLSSS